MKRHAIIPIFIPQEGCPNGCIFCNQKKITARQKAPTKDEIQKTAERYLSTLSNPRPEVIEMAMYGGSFTGIPIERQKYYLEIALDYKKRGIIDQIHLSTRPDYIDEKILTLLKRYEVDTIELGVQSFDKQVLARARRGHSPEAVYRSGALIKSYGFTLGIQLMIGLPGDSLEKACYSAMETVKIGPALARLYPTVILEETELCEMYRRGDYLPFSTEEMVSVTKEMYRILSRAGIRILRIGLKSTDLIQEGRQILGGNYHPAFRQLVEGEIAKEDLSEQLKAILTKNIENETEFQSLRNGTVPKQEIHFFSSPRSFSNMIGNGGRNKQYFQTRYPGLTIRFKTDQTLAEGTYVAKKQSTSQG